MNANYKRSKRGQIPLLPWMNLIVTIGAVVLFVMASGWYACFRTNDLVFDRFSGFGQHTYKYDQVVEVARVQKWVALNGKVHQKPHIALRFNDGSSWNSLDGGRSMDSATNETILAIILSKTQLTPTAYDLPPW